MKRIKKLFTLIELIVVIVVLGVLAAIVIPNISSFKEEAKETAILSDARNIQTAVDMFMLEKDGKTPTNEKASLGNPQIIELYGLTPNYLRDMPKDNGAKFWLDENNTVWASMVDSPTNVNFDEGLLTWNTVDGAELYKIYKTEDAITASAKGSLKLEFIEDVIPLNNSEPSKTLPVLTKGTYLVTAIDVFNFESAPTKVNTSYEGYKEGPNKDFTVDVPLNKKPLAVIGVNPETNINTETTIVWSYSGSSDPDNDIIKTAEWKIDGVIKDSIPEKLPEGTFNIELRVQDEKGAWSDSVSREIVVTKHTPIVFTFTNAGATGLSGPTQSQLNSSYSGSELEGKVVSNLGIQNWTIPVTGNYKIEVFGASGGNTIGAVGGKGAKLSGEFKLNKDTNLKLLVGQKGVDVMSSGNYSTGGGGGTFVATSNNQPLIVAGGGGGVFFNQKGEDSIQTTTSPSGTAGSNTGSGTGNGGGNGAGFHYNGPTTSYSGITYSFINGGKGGKGVTSNTDGGFGGGGGTHQNSGGGGGGGGYIGGSGSKSASAGKGGVSYNSGLNPSTVTGVNLEHGKIIITYLGQ